MYYRLGARLNLIIGTVGVLATTALFLFIGLETNLWWVRAIMFLRGCFIAFNMVSMQTALFSDVPRSKTGRASSLWNTSRQIAVAVGTAVSATVLISQLPSASAAVGGLAGVPPEDGLRAFHTSVAVLLIMAAMAVFFALQVRERPTAAEPQRPAAEVEVEEEERTPVHAAAD
jgi:sugar phosphate permease